MECFFNLAIDDGRIARAWLRKLVKIERGECKEKHIDHAAYLVIIKYPLTKTTQNSEIGRNTFQPRRIS